MNDSSVKTTSSNCSSMSIIALENATLASLLGSPVSWQYLGLVARKPAKSITRLAVDKKMLHPFLLGSLKTSLTDELCFFPKICFTVSTSWLPMA